ncbi:MAG: M42 family metallopeptidase [Defluviitaleaceae bacterium]|nr:M42 family metallopeptidase [Defluviitaleaceae bacterium]
MNDFNMKDYVLNFAQKLLAIDSPSGYCMEAIKFVKEEVEKLGYTTSMNAKGNLIIDIPGESDKTVGLSAHVDTLGLMVRSIKSDGTLAFTPIGGPIIPTCDGEYCRIRTRDGKVYTGTILSNHTSSHVYKEAATAARNADTMHIRVDERVKSKEDVLKLGIQNGDFIAIDTKTQVTESAFIKSRFLDDKISVACVIGVLAYLKESQVTVRHNTKIIISTYEEVGHGCSHVPAGIEELVAVDMGCIGGDLECTEYDVSICAKDSSGPYDYELTSKLIELAKDEKLNYVVDIYPMYGSDVSAALSGGNDIRGALIGPGIAASHGMERTHWDGVNNTIKLLLAYLIAD